MPPANEASGGVFLSFCKLLFLLFLYVALNRPLAIQSDDRLGFEASFVAPYHQICA